MERLIPEPRPGPNLSDEEIRYQLARRSVVLQLHDMYDGKPSKVISRNRR